MMCFEEKKKVTDVRAAASTAAWHVRVYWTWVC